MNRFFERYKAVIIWIMVIGFFLGGVGLVAFRYFTPGSNSGNGDGSSKTVALLVNGEKIYEQRFQSVYDNIVSQQESLYRRFGQDFSKLLEGTSGNYYKLRLKSRAIDQLVRQTIVTQEANQRGINPNQDVVQQRYDKELNSLLEQQDWSLDQLKSALRAQDRTYEEFERTVKANIKQQIKLEQLKKQVAGKIDPTDEELKNYYSEHKDNYVQTPAKVNASHLQFDTQTEAKTVLEQVQTGSKTFDQYAEEEENVDMGWFQKGDKSPGVEDLAFSLEVGEVGGPVQTAEGWELIRIDDKQDREVPSFDSIKDQVRSDYISAQRDEKYQEWYSEVEKNADIELKLPLLKAYRTAQNEGFEQGLAAYKDLQETNPMDYPYLPYYIGRLYEQRAGELETDLSETDKEERKEELNEKISKYEKKAVSNYMEVVRETGSNDQDLLSRVLALAPKNPEANYYLGIAQMNQARYTQAVNNFKTAIESKSDYVAAYIKYGDVLVTLDNYEKAIQQYKKVLDMSGDNVSVLNKLAQAYKESGNFEKAEETYKKALDVNPGNFDAKKGLGDLYREGKKFEQAIKYYNDALAVRADTETGVSLGRTYLQNGDLDEAKSEFENVLTTDPYNAKAYLGIGDVYMQKDMPEMALDQYRDGLARTQSGDLVIKLAKRIIDQKPNDLETRFTLARAYREKHIYESAIEQYKAILTRTDSGTEKREAYSGLGDSYLKKTDYDQAKEYYQNGLDVSETEVERLTFYKGLLNADQEKNGEDNLTETGKRALLKIAEINVNQGDQANAEEKLNRLKELDPNYQKDKVEKLLNEISGTNSEK